MLNWKIDKIRYAPDKLTLVLVNHTDAIGKKELHITLENYLGELRAVARIGDEIVWSNRVQYKHFNPP